MFEPFKPFNPLALFQDSLRSHSDRVEKDKLRGQSSEQNSEQRGTQRGEQAGKKPSHKAGSSLTLKGRALRYLSSREHSRSELERKLAAHEETPGQLAQVLDDLQAKDFISEQRVADSVVHRKSARFGAARVRFELQSKGLGAQVVADALETLKADELERATVVWRKKFATPAVDAAARAKQARFLAGRGFGGDVIRRVIARLDEESS